MSQSKPPSSARSGQSSRDPVMINSLNVRVKFNNNLPDIPFDPKFIVNPLNVSRFIKYETTSLEHNAKHELLTPTDLGVDIDLILPERYAIPPNPIHDPEDDRLINDDEPLLQSTKKSPRDKPHSQLHNKVVPWLKKTEYISTEYNRYGSSNEKTETKVGYNVRKNMKEDEILMDKESQVRAINQTFEAAQQPIREHPNKPGVHATRVMPLFPDYENYKYFFAYVRFDNEPLDSSKSDQMSQAIIRGAYDQELQESFVVYFLPTEVTMTDRLLDQRNGLNYTEGKEYEYKSSREYSWSAKQNDQSDHFFFVFRDDEVYYNRLSMDVVLKKRRNKSQNATISTLVVKNREMDEEELEGQRGKLVQLEKPALPVERDNDLTAQSLEQSYEEMAKDRQADDAVEGDMNSPREASSAGSSSPASESSVASSSPLSSSASSSSSSSSSSEEESDDN